MNKSIIYTFFILFTILIAGCENVDVSKISDKDLERISEKAVICNPPYIRVGVECCLDRDSNAICDIDEAEETQLSETKVVEAYLNNIAAQNIDEYIAATKDSLRYVTGYAKDYYNELLLHLKEQKKIFNEFYNDFWIKCKEIDTIKRCEQSQKGFLDSFNSGLKMDVNIITVELKEERKSVYTEREEISPSRKQTVIKDYLIKKENGLWKIYDWIDEEGNKWSDISIEEEKLQNQESIKEMKETYKWALNTIQETIEKQAIQTQAKTKKDKCSYLEESKGLTATELEYEFQICYQGKYIDYALVTKDASVCEEIVKPWYYSPCVASVASQKNDISLCKKIKYEEWEARAYQNKLTTRDYCYYSFVFYKYADMDKTEIEEACNKISNIQLKTQCLALEELGSLFSDDWLSDEEEIVEKSQVEILDYNDRLSSSGNYLSITGEVKNTGNSTAKSVKVTAKFYKDDGFIDRDYAYVDNYDIAAGETDTFEISWRIQDYDKYELLVS